MLIQVDAHDGLSGVEIEFSVADGATDEAEDEDTEIEQSNPRSETIRSITTPLGKSVSVLIHGSNVGGTATRDITDQ